MLCCKYENIASYFPVASTALKRSAMRRTSDISLPCCIKNHDIARRLVAEHSHFGAINPDVVVDVILPVGVDGLRFEFRRQKCFEHVHHFGFGRV